MSEGQDEPSAWGDDSPEVPPVVGISREPPPAIVYLPTRRFSPADPVAEFILWRLDDDSLALPVFTALELLVAACGEDQPWVRMRLDSPSGSAELAQACGAASVLTDGNVTDGG